MSSHMIYKPTFSQLISDASKRPKRYVAGLAGPWLGHAGRFVIVCTPVRAASSWSRCSTRTQRSCATARFLGDEVLFPRRFEGRAVRADDGAHAYGFKLQVNQLLMSSARGPGEVPGEPSPPGTQDYRLRRRNLLKQVLSFARQIVVYACGGRRRTKPFPTPVARSRRSPRGLTQPSRWNVWPTTPSPDTAHRPGLRGRPGPPPVTAVHADRMFEGLGVRRSRCHRARAHLTDSNLRRARELRGGRCGRRSDPLCESSSSTGRVPGPGSKRAVWRTTTQWGRGREAAVGSGQPC